MNQDDAQLNDWLEVYTTNATLFQNKLATWFFQPWMDGEIICDNFKLFCFFHLAEALFKSILDKDANQLTV